MNCPTCDVATSPSVDYQSVSAAADAGYTCANNHRWETVPGGIVLPLPSVSTGVILTVNKPAQSILADGQAFGTVTVTDPRKYAAVGKVIRLRVPPGGSADVDADSFILDKYGMATALFRPTYAITGELTFEFYYASGEADPVSFTIRRGS